MTEQTSPGEPLVLPAADTGWLGKNVPGTLTLDKGRLRFETAEGVAFDVPVGELQKPAFSSGDSVFKVSAAGQKYRFYFGKVAGIVDDFDVDAALVRGAEGFVDSRQAGKALKAALGM